MTRLSMTYWTLALLIGASTAALAAPAEKQREDASRPVIAALDTDAARAQLRAAALADVREDLRRQVREAPLNGTLQVLGSPKKQDDDSAADTRG